MDSAPAACRAFAEAVVFPRYFNAPKHPRQQGPTQLGPPWQGKLACPRDARLPRCRLAVPAGAGTFVAIALFGARKR
jgi:hypothetical protein